MEARVLLFSPAATAGVGCKLQMPALAIFLIIPTGQVFCYGQPVDTFDI